MTTIAINENSVETKVKKNTSKKSAPAKTINTRYIQMPEWLACSVGSIIGALITFLTFYTAHKGHGIICMILTAGGLFYSAPTMYDLMMRLTEDFKKAAGFVLLLEGVMTFTNIPVFWSVTTAHIALVFLMSANAYMFAQIALNKLAKPTKKTVKKTAKK